MADRAWKQFERAIASLVGGRRFPANSGASLDVESASVVAQCKLVKRLSLAELTDLAEQVEREAAPKFKAGIVAMKHRRGRGVGSPILVVMTASTWARLNGTPLLPFDVNESPKKGARP